MSSRDSEEPIASCAHIGVSCPIRQSGGDFPVGASGGTGEPPLSCPGKGRQLSSVSIGPKVPSEPGKAGSSGHSARARMIAVPRTIGISAALIHEYPNEKLPWGPVYQPRLWNSPCRGRHGAGSR
jgi:hypothetical protein